MSSIIHGVELNPLHSAMGIKHKDKTSQVRNAKFALPPNDATKYFVIEKQGKLHLLIGFFLYYVQCALASFCSCGIFAHASYLSKSLCRSIPISCNFLYMDLVEN